MLSFVVPKGKRSPMAVIVNPPLQVRLIFLNLPKSAFNVPPQPQGDDARQSSEDDGNRGEKKRNCNFCLLTHTS